MKTCRPGYLFAEENQQPARVVIYPIQYTIVRTIRGKPEAVIRDMI